MTKSTTCVDVHHDMSTCCRTTRPDKELGERASVHVGVRF